MLHCEGVTKIRDEVLTQVVEHARREGPLECCGLLVGTSGEIVEAVEVSNTAADPRRHYRIDPVEHLSVIRTARSRGLAVIGAYHSHPAGPALPSDTDRAEAFGHFLFVIVGMGAEPPSILAWMFECGNFVPVSLVRSSRG